MKDNLENVFKEKFENFEADFDANSWEAMNKKLDAVSTHGGGSSNSWLWIAATVGAILITGSLFYLTNESNRATTEGLTENTLRNENTKAHDVSTVDKIHPTEPETVVDSPIQSTDVEENKPNATEEPVTLEQKETTESNSTKNIAAKKNSEENATAYVEENSSTTQEIDGPLPHKSIDVPSTNEKEEKETVQPRKRRFISGVVEQKTPALDFVSICVGEPLIIKNPSQDNETVRVSYNNREIDIPAGQYTQLSLNKNVTVNFLNEDNEVIHQQEVVVSPIPQVDFTYEANIYEEGLPVVKLESYNNYPATEWTINDNTVTGSNPTVNLFEKGEYEVTMFFENENGCSTTKTRTVTIDENYNLMAVSAFKPNDADPRNRTFMPFSLTQRDVQFTLTIVDPTDNGVVFTSKDASHAWDGTDTRTGKMTKSEKIFMWKVQLDNPLPNEKSVYIGTVTHH